MSGGYHTWTGVCELPRLKTLVHVEGCGTHGGGGAWYARDSVNLFDAGLMSKPVIEADSLPFKIGKPDSLHARLLKQWLSNSEPASGKALLDEVVRVEAKRHDRYHLPKFPGLLDQRVTSAVWDAQGHLLVGREGWIERYRPEDLERGEPVFRRDLTNVPRVSRKDF